VSTALRTSAAGLAGSRCAGCRTGACASRRSRSGRASGFRCGSRFRSKWAFCRGDFPYHFLPEISAEKGQIGSCLRLINLKCRKTLHLADTLDLWKGILENPPPGTTESKEVSSFSLKNRNGPFVVHVCAKCAQSRRARG